MAQYRNLANHASGKARGQPTVHEDSTLFSL